jgi:hypothetical protein
MWIADTAVQRKNAVVKIAARRWLENMFRK